MTAMELKIVRLSDVLAYYESYALLSTSVHFKIFYLTGISSFSWASSV